MDPPPRRLAAPLLLLLLVAAASPTARAWKKDEFRNCNQTPFCKRARTRAPHSLDAPLSLTAGSLVVSPDGSISAELSHPSRPRPLVLRLSALPPHALRLQIDEDYSTATPPHRRFQVPDVLLPDLEARTLHLAEPKTAAGVSTVALSSDLDVVFKHDPFELTVRRAGSGDPVLSFNSHGLFDFEPLQVSKPEGETWEEHFRSHTDKRPRGPQSITFDVSFYGADFVYGLPEHGSTSLALRPTRGPGVEESEPYRLFNLDVFEYLHESPFGLYGSIPFMIGHGARASSGFFWLNAAEMQIDVLAPGWDEATTPDNGRIDTLWMAEAGVIDAFFFVGSEPKDVVKQYVSVTGTPAMPQQFATAYHQCRWNYRDEADVDGVDAGFDEHDIPYDVLWLDIEHTDGKRYFTWDHSAFPNPEEMQRKIADKGRKMVTIVDPHIKRDSSFHLHQEATEKGYYVKDADGNDYDGWCWPGSSSYPDMLNPEIREWWGDKFSYENYKGSTPTLYIWNDMNEPSVFNGPEVCRVIDL
jgi:alpha 1,3-glucosidase